jgi:hypothetical protein
MASADANHQVSLDASALFGVQLLGQTLPRLLALVQSPPFGSTLLPGQR